MDANIQTEPVYKVISAYVNGVREFLFKVGICLLADT